MPIHFEELWNKCEELQRDIVSDESTSAILEELEIKLNLYKALTHKEIPEKEREIVKSRIMGEILLTLTKLSMKDNVNVYEALSVAMQYRSIDLFKNKYST